MQSAFSKVFTTCAKSNLDFQNKAVLLQVSGGPDSIFLLHSFYSLFKEITKKIEVLTIDFALRKESNLEANFVVDICDSLKLSCHLIRSPQIMGKNIQKKARDFRLQKVAEFMKKNELDFTLMGHHRDDLLETLFLKLKRGAGLFSLTSFNVKQGNLIRPLLNYSKREILEHLQTLNIPYVIDSSNLKNDYSRNQIRNRIFPVLDDNLTNWRSGILLSYLDLSQANSLLRRFIFLNKMIRIHQGMLFLTSKFMKLTSYHQQIVLKLYLKKIGIISLSRKLLTEITRKIIQKNHTKHLFNGKIYASEKGVFYKWPTTPSPFTLNLEEHVLYQNNYFSFILKGGEKNQDKKAFFHFSSSSEIKNLCLRPIQPGDRLILFKVGGKKIGDIFTDAKVPLLLRRLSLAITIDDEILAVIIPQVQLFNFFKKHRGLKRDRPILVSQKTKCKRGVHQYTFIWQEKQI